MSRPIKFRAWWKHPKYMPNGRMYMVGGLDNIQKAAHSNGEPEKPIASSVQNVLLTEALPTNEKLAWNDAKYCTLMQFTGLKDKNGVEIYEGDIFVDDEYPDEPISYAVISWSDKWGGWCNDWWTPKELVEDAKNYEVIGNIYENPELVEKSDES